jgi:hypothetical protein
MSTVKINIPINFEQLVEAIKQLNSEEKLELGELMWDESSPIPIEHQEIVLSRIKEARKNPAKMLDWDEVEKTL